MVTGPPRADPEAQTTIMNGGASSNGRETRWTARDLVAAAALGERWAWDELVGRYAQRVWDVARNEGLSADAAAEVSAITWMKCADRLDDLLDGSPIDEWLIAVAGDESSRRHQSFPVRSAAGAGGKR